MTTNPLTPQRKWRAIAVATVVFAPGYWSILAGLVALAADDSEGGPLPAAAIAFGLASIPFVFVTLAFLSEHPRAPKAALKAMGLSLLVGLMVSAIAVDAVTGLVAGMGAGGICALRAEEEHSTRTRAVGVTVAALYTFVLVRTIGPAALLAAVAFPFTALGIADHFSERARRREREPADSTG
jgi:hypothetical protein